MDNLEAHAGFLGCAEILEPMISHSFEEMERAGVQRVLFTGHSAGGAVASLLYLRYLSRKYAECIVDKRGHSRSFDSIRNC